MLSAKKGEIEIILGVSQLAVDFLYSSTAVEASLISEKFVSVFLKHDSPKNI